MNAAERLAELAALADAATPGPWVVQDGDEVHAPHLLGQEEASDVATIFDADADAAFIAASREAVPALIAALRAVLDLHESSLDTRDVGRVIDGEWTPYCEECGDPYPCAEVRAIDAALGVTS